MFRWESINMTDTYKVKHDQPYPTKLALTERPDTSLLETVFENGVCLASRTFAPEPVTPMKQEYFNMLVIWRTANPKITTASLAENLQKRFRLAAGPALILASRFKNELHTQGLL